TRRIPRDWVNRSLWTVGQPRRQNCPRGGRGHKRPPSLSVWTAPVDREVGWSPSGTPRPRHGAPDRPVRPPGPLALLGAWGPVRRAIVAGVSENGIPRAPRGLG